MLLSLPVLMLLAPQPAPSPRAAAPAPRGPSRVEASPRPEASEEASGTEAPATATDKSKDREAAREKEEPPVVTRHEARVGGRTLRYTVTTGMMPLKNEAGETEASVFYMAYVADRTGGPEKRPLTFSFNGGPGSSSVWLHLGAIGPKRVRMLEEGGMPAPPFELSTTTPPGSTSRISSSSTPWGRATAARRSRRWGRSSGASRATSSPSATSSVSI